MEFRVLGAFEVWNAGRALPIGKGRQRTLLAMLLVHRNGMVSAEQLIEELWPAGAPPTARTSLHRYISQLRKVLGRDRLITTGTGYELSAADGETDSERFESLLRDGQAEVALRLWHGPALAEWIDRDFARTEIERLASLRLLAVEQRIDADVRNGKFAEAAAALERETREHPFRERFRYLQMLALYGSGRQAEALSVYRDTRQALIDELGLEPSVDIVELHQRILRQDPTLLGKHQPPAANKPIRRSRTPVTTREDWPFAAREEEFDVLTSVIARGVDEPDKPAGAVVFGPPGVGKTRLIREALAWAQEQQLHTAWAIGTRSAGLMPYAALAHLAPELAPSEYDDPAALYRGFAAALLGADRRRFVLAIDDAHLLDPGSAALVLHLAMTGAATVIASARRGEPVPDPITALWKDGLAVRIDLQLFSAEETADLVSTALGGVISAHAKLRLAERSGGNALYARELVIGALETGALRQADGGWVWDGPNVLAPRLVDAVSQRLEGLSGTDRTALGLIALGEPLPIAVVDQTIAPASIARIESAGLAHLAEEGAEVNCRLTHPLYGEVILTQLGVAERRRLMRILADAVADYGTRSDHDLMRIASWRLDAGVDLSPGYLTQAATIANESFDYDLGQRLAQAAVDHSGRPSATVALAQAFVGKNQFEAAESMLAECESKVLAGTDRELQHSYLNKRFIALYEGLGRRDETVAMLDRFLAQHHDQDSQYLVAGFRATVLLDEGRMQEVMATTAPVLADSGADDFAVFVAARLAGEASAYLGNTAAARKIHVRLRELASIGSPKLARARMSADLQEVLCQTLEGRATEVEKIVTSYYQQVRSSQDDMDRGLAALAVATTLLMRGKPVSARKGATDALEAFRRIDIAGVVPWAHAVLAQSHAVVGDLPAAHRAQQASREHPVSRRSARSESDFVAADALVEMAAGNLTDAIRIALDGAERLKNLVMPRGRLLHLALRLGATPSAVAEPLAKIAANAECDLPGIWSNQANALVRHDPRALEAVADQFEALGLTLCAAEAAAQAAVEHRQAGSSTAAARAESRSTALLAKCEGAITPPVADSKPPEQLSRREYEVSQLAADGLSNAQIAKRFVVSVRTVESHLYQAFAKLGVVNRTDLATALPDAAPGGPDQ